jgi:hypothetical protein
MIPVEGHKGLYRDNYTGAILNCDQNEYNNYKQTKELKLIEKNEIEKLREELNELKLVLKIYLKDKI